MMYLFAALHVTFPPVRSKTDTWENFLQIFAYMHRRDLVKSTCLSLSIFHTIKSTPIHNPWKRLGSDRVVTPERGNLGGRESCGAPPPLWEPNPPRGTARVGPCTEQQWYTLEPFSSLCMLLKRKLDHVRTCSHECVYAFWFNACCRPELRRRVCHLRPCAMVVVANVTGRRSVRNLNDVTVLHAASPWSSAHIVRGDG